MRPASARMIKAFGRGRQSSLFAADAEDTGFQKNMRVARIDARFDQPFTSRHWHGEPARVSGGSWMIG